MHTIVTICWVQGIEAVKQLESKGIQTHVNFVYR